MSNRRLREIERRLLLIERHAVAANDRTWKAIGIMHRLTETIAKATDTPTPLAKIEQAAADAHHELSKLLPF